MKRITFKWLVIGSLLVGASWQVLADDLFPPPWLRGSPGTTFLETSFPTGANPTTPDPGWYNPNGVPQITVAGIWSPLVDNRPGVWDIRQGGFMSVLDPNYDNLNPVKTIFLQMVYDGEGTAQPNITVNGVLGTKVDSIPLGPAFWEYGRWQFELQPNPAEELIQISGNLEICEIVVDTICIPEPGTGLLVALGAGLVLVVRRRH